MKLWQSRWTAPALFMLGVVAVFVLCCTTWLDSSPRVETEFEAYCEAPRDRYAFGVCVAELARVATPRPKETAEQLVFRIVDRCRESVCPPRIRVCSYRRSLIYARDGQALGCTDWKRVKP